MARRLSGKDVDTFLQQISDSKSNPLARDTLARDLPLAHEYLEKGIQFFA